MIRGRAALHPQAFMYCAIGVFGHESGVMAAQEGSASMQYGLPTPARTQGWSREIEGTPPMVLVDELVFGTCHGLPAPACTKRYYVHRQTSLKGLAGERGVCSAAAPAHRTKKAAA